MAHKKTVAGQNREKLRQSFWPGADDWFWKSAAEPGGYFCAPRVLPLILQILSNKQVTGEFDCGQVYVELLARDMGEGLIEISDEREHADFVGYAKGKRGIRSWTERILKLKEIGFIDIRPKGSREIGYIGIVHPSIALHQLRSRRLIDDGMWALIQKRQIEVKAPFWGDPKLQPGLTVVDGGKEATHQGSVETVAAELKA